MKDEGNHQGVVDKSFSEQWIYIVDANYILCEINWTHTCSGTGPYGRQVADEIEVKPAVTRTNDQGLTNPYGSVVFHIQHRLVWFSGSLKPQAGSFNR